MALCGLVLLAMWLSIDPGEVDNPFLYALAGLVITALGGLWVFSAFKTEAKVTNKAGQVIRCQVNLFEKARDRRVLRPCQQGDSGGELRHAMTQVPSPTQEALHVHWKLHGALTLRVDHP